MIVIVVVVVRVVVVVVVVVVPFSGFENPPGDLGTFSEPGKRSNFRRDPRETSL